MSHAKNPGSCIKIHPTSTLATSDRHARKIENVCCRCGDMLPNAVWLWCSTKLLEQMVSGVSFSTAAASDFSSAIRIEAVFVACRLTRSARRSSWQKSLSCWGCVSSPGQEIANCIESNARSYFKNKELIDIYIYWIILIECSFPNPW